MALSPVDKEVARLEAQAEATGAAVDLSAREGEEVYAGPTAEEVAQFTEGFDKRVEDVLGMVA